MDCKAVNNEVMISTNWTDAIKVIGLIREKVKVLIIK